MHFEAAGLGLLGTSRRTGPLRSVGKGPRPTAFETYMQRQVFKGSRVSHDTSLSDVQRRISLD